MKKTVRFEIVLNERIARDTFRILLRGDCGSITAPGQFVNVALPGKYLRRPISVCSVQGDELTLIYKTVGAGTLLLSGMQPGETLDVLTGLGNGFDIRKDFQHPLLIGGGAGAAPMYALAQALLEIGKQPTVVLGFNTAEEIFLQSEMEALGLRCYVSTADGSAGTRGFVTDVLKTETIEHDYLFVCGPEPMLKAVYSGDTADGQFSFESRMACGFGACMGCSCETVKGAKRICTDGPVLEREEILW